MRSKDFVFTAEIPRQAATTAGDVKTIIETLRPVVDAVQIENDHAALGHVDPLAIASIAIGLGVDPVLHLSCRDRNRIGLQSSLLGAALIGVSSVMLMQGQKLPDTLRGKVKGVFDTTAIQLIEMARMIGVDSSRPGSTELYIGSRVSVIRPGADWQASKLEKRVAAGAKFLLTSPCLNTRMLRSYVARLVALKITHRASLLVDVPLLSSAQMVKDVRESRPGSRIPKDVVQALAAAENPAAEGYRICRDAIIEMKTIPGVSGVNIIYAGDPDAVAELISEVRG
jgi:methylenetetrahydrofolate reductase (NADPH)